MKLKVLALAATLGLTTMAAQASELPDGPHIVTSGTASVAAVPDIATLAIEVNVSAKDAASAKKQADDRVAQYLSFLEKSGIAKKDINSANLRTQPDYDYQAALRTVDVSNLRWKSCRSSRLRKAAMALAMRTASVVTFMPPAVEPGAPPVSISKMVTA